MSFPPTLRYAFSVNRLGDHDDVVAYVQEKLDAAPPPAPPRQLVRPAPLWRWIPLVLGVTGMLTVVQVGTAAVDHFSAPRINEPCAEHRDCGVDEHCLMHLPPKERYCSRACAPDAPCPAGMRCGDLAAIPEAVRGVGAAGPVAASSACVR